jgi:hypothetical protein
MIHQHHSRLVSLWWAATAVLVLVVLQTTTAAPCACFVPPSANAHCSASFNQQVLVIRAKLLSQDSESFEVQLLQVVFTNSLEYVYFGQGMSLPPLCHRLPAILTDSLLGCSGDVCNASVLTVQVAECPPTLVVNQSYWMRLVVTHAGLQFQACDFIAPDTEIIDKDLSCGKPLSMSCNL